MLPHNLKHGDSIVTVDYRDVTEPYVYLVYTCT